MWRRIRRTMLLLPVTAACHQRAGAVPVIESLTPAMADITRPDPVDVIVAGRGFDSLNTVYFGPVELRQVPRISATSLRFMVPRDDAQVPGRGGAPVLPLPGGRYDVRVGTRQGTSNTLPFTVVGSNR